MYEDPEIELAALRPGGRVLCIASAGCTALALADRAFTVTALDVNPRQAEYARARVAGHPPRAGAAERMLAGGRSVMAVLGWRRDELEHFLALDSTDAQIRFWRERLDTRRFRGVLAAALRPVGLRRLYAADFAAAVPESFDRVLRRRLERGFARHANRTNPFARLLLLGAPEQASRPRAPAGEVRVLEAEVADYLERAEPRSFDGFSLSNVLDGAEPAFAARLERAMARAAAPGARMVLRSFAEPRTPDEAAWAARDRSMLWGRVRVEPVGAP